MAKAKHILILKFPYSSTFGGGEKHTLTLVEKLSSKYSFSLVSTCSVLLPEFKKRHWPAERMWAGTEPVTPWALLKFIFLAPFITLQLLQMLLRYRFSHNVDTLYCLSLTEKVLLTPWARLLGIRVLWVEHLQIERWLLASPLRVLYVLWSRLVTIVTVVEAVKSQLVRIKVPERNIRVIYNSVNSKEFVPHPSNIERTRQQFRVLFVGRLAEEKGVTDLITAIALIKTDIPHIRLDIVGRGEWQNTLENLVEEKHLQKFVRFVGWQDNIAQWMQQSDVFVLPATRRETFGIVIAEALATVVPVITTTIGGLPEVVGHYGWLVEPHASDQIANALREIYADYDQAIRKAHGGRLHVLELFREETMIQEYDKLFQGA